jgi:hypothetical protein
LVVHGGDGANGSMSVIEPVHGVDVHTILTGAGIAESLLMVLPGLLMRSTCVGMQL